MMSQSDPLRPYLGNREVGSHLFRMSDHTID